MEDLSNYDKLKEDASNYYNNISKIHSPAFDEYIAFNAEGFNHIIYKTARTEREKPSQIMRFKLLPLARKLIEISTTFIDGRKIKVILRKIGENGKMHFWSIVPAWTTNKYRDIKFITTMKGSPEED